MKLISWNVNGIRAIERKGELQNLLNSEKPDILFIQETKASPEQLSTWLTQNPDYHQNYHAAEKKGYSGVSVWLHKNTFPVRPTSITGMQGWDDHEGRVIRFEYENFCLLGVYFPNGGKSDEAWQEKLRFYDHFLAHINRLRGQGKSIIFCGDLNVAHNEIDLARPKENEKNVGFRPEERSWVSRLIANDWVDSFRESHPDRVSYTWWDMPSRARERNVGWRIDYFFLDRPLRKKVVSDRHLNEQQGSDHCPVVLEIDLSR